MSVTPPFLLRNAPEVLGLPHVGSKKSTLGFGSGNARAVPPEPAAGYVARCLAWAQGNGRCATKTAFASRLDGRQISAELFDHGIDRSLIDRLKPFLNFNASGDLYLIDAGGEAVVFGDSKTQRVIKLFAPPNEGRFGWVLDRTANGRWSVRGGSLDEALMRFLWFEVNFASGLELDTIGAEADFLTLSQPFLVGRRPCEDELEEWMLASGWETWAPPTDQALVGNLTWRRGSYVATDVVPRNAIVAEADGQLRAIDFIVTCVED
jgi:hypothetical protein